MATPKKYFHDRLVLLLLSINAFLVLASTLTLLFRNIDPSGTFAVEYRARLGLNAFTSGGATEIYSFAVFAVIIFVFHFYLSRKAYPIRRHFAIVVLGMATLLLTLAILVSNALLLY